MQVTTRPSAENATAPTPPGPGESAASPPTREDPSVRDRSAARSPLAPSGHRGAWRYLGLTLLLLLFFNSGAEWIRVAKGQLRSGRDLVTRGLVWPPWRVLQLYVSHDSDEHLFFEYTRLMLGEPADLDYIAAANHGDTPAIKKQLEEKFPPLPKGRFPFRYLAVGYPPVGLLTLLVPRLWASTLSEYRLGFGVLMGALFLGTMALGWRLQRHCAVPQSYERFCKDTALLLFCVGPTLMMRYDIVPALLTAAVVLALIERRALLATTCLVLGVAAKLYPALLLPIWLALLYGFSGTARRTAGRMLLALFSLLALVGPAVLARGPALPLVAERLTFSVRPFQLESIPGALLALPRWPASLSASFGSFNTDSALAVRLLPYWELLIYAAVLAISGLAYVWARRRRHYDPSAQAQALCVWTLTALLADLCVTKVLSAQYLIWCLPFAALVPGRRGRFILGALAITLLLTQLIYPTLYGALIGGSAAVLGLLLLRNALLCVICVVSLLWLWRGQLIETGVPCRKR